MEVQRTLDHYVSEDAIRSGLKAVQLPGRFQVTSLPFSNTFSIAHLRDPLLAGLYNNKRFSSGCIV